jgi:hypothetical protein
MDGTKSFSTRKQHKNIPSERALSAWRARLFHRLEVEKEKRMEG